jgi:hypothetical protein
VLVSDAQRHRLGPLDFPMTGAGLAVVITMTRAVLPVDLIPVGVEAGTIITVAALLSVRVILG